MNRYAGRYHEQGLCESVESVRPCPRLATRTFTKENPRWASTVYVLCDQHAQDEGQLLIDLGGYSEMLFS